jgi:hypothetical protein
MVRVINRVKKQEVLAFRERLLDLSSEAITKELAATSTEEANIQKAIHVVYATLVKEFEAVFIIPPKTTYPVGHE